MTTSVFADRVFKLHEEQGKDDNLLGQLELFDNQSVNIVHYLIKNKTISIFHINFSSPRA